MLDCLLGLPKKCHFPNSKKRDSFIIVYNQAKEHTRVSLRGGNSNNVR